VPPFHISRYPEIIEEYTSKIRQSFVTIRMEIEGVSAVQH